MRDKRIDNVLNNGFKQNPQNINRKGRPKKTVTKILDELKEKNGKLLTKAEIQETYVALLDETEESLLEMSNSKETSMLIRILAKAMLDKKGFDIIERMLDRSIGKAIEERHNTGEIQFSVVQYDKPKIIDSK